MNRTPSHSFTLPPRLSMDDYMDFVEVSIREANPVLAARQKSIEKQILKPFSLSAKISEPEAVPAASGSATNQQPNQQHSYGATVTETLS